MIKSDLEKWRLRAPFYIVSTTLLPFVYIFFSEVKDSEVKIIQSIITFICFIFAFFYTAMKMRNRFWIPELEKYVGLQIKTELIKLAPDDLQIKDEERKELVEKEIWKKLTGVFWEAIDSDPTLCAQKEHFYVNGVLYTTSIDMFLILPFISVINVVAFNFFRANPLFLYSAIMCLVITLISRYLALPSCRKRHLELSNEQLDFLRRKKKKFISNRFREIILEWRSKKEA